MVMLTTFPPNDPRKEEGGSESVWGKVWNKTLEKLGVKPPDLIDGKEINAPDDTISPEELRYQDQYQEKITALNSNGLVGELSKFQSEGNSGIVTFSVEKELKKVQSKFRGNTELKDFFKFFQDFSDQGGLGKIFLIDVGDDDDKKENKLRGVYMIIGGEHLVKVHLEDFAQDRFKAERKDFWREGDLQKIENQFRAWNGEIMTEDGDGIKKIKNAKFKEDQFDFCGSKIPDKILERFRAAHKKEMERKKVADDESQKKEKLKNIIALKKSNQRQIVGENNNGTLAEIDYEEIRNLPQKGKEMLIVRLNREMVEINKERLLVESLKESDFALDVTFYNLLLPLVDGKLMREIAKKRFIQSIVRGNKQEELYFKNIFNNLNVGIEKMEKDIEKLKLDPDKYNNYDQLRIYRGLKKVI